ncbi:MAG TPA: chaperonin GroEL [Pseudomonadales bacterium]|nr:chaperonin GroEL [Pseudomonadales bacterium]
MISNKSLIFDEEARAQLLKGVNLLTDAVKITMGPGGQNVVIEKPNAPPYLTKDGVTVARVIKVKDKMQNLGVQMVKEAAARTADVAGDGTTTATVLAQAIFQDGLRLLAAGYSCPEIRKGIEFAKNQVIQELRNAAIPVSSDDEIIQVGTISANGDQTIGELLCEAMKSVGRDGIITVEEAKGFKTSLAIVEGMEIDRGYLSPYFINDQEKMACVLEKPLILLLSKKLTTLQNALSILEKVHRAQRPLLIVAGDIEGEAMQGLVVNKLKGTLDVCAIRSPGFGEGRINCMSDLGLLLGCEIYGDIDDNSLNQLNIADLGNCKRVIIKKDRTTFIGGEGSIEKIEERSGQLRRKLADPTLIEAEAVLTRLRLNRLTGGIAVLRVGGTTELDLVERKDRVEDALHATQAAVEEGILPGGGVALIRAAQVLASSSKTQSSSFCMGIEIVKSACQVPLKQIVTNAGGTSEIILEKVSKFKHTRGYDAKGEKFVDMMESGIIDPLKVVRTALENAAATAGMLLSVGCAIVEHEEQDNEFIGSEIYHAS